MEVKTISVTDEEELSWQKLTGVYVLFCRLSSLLPFEGCNFNYLVTRLATIYELVCTALIMLMCIVYNIERRYKTKRNSLISITRSDTSLQMRTGRQWKPDELYFTIISVGLYLRYYLVLWRRDQFTKLFLECRQLWQFCDEKGRATVTKYERKIRILYGMYAVNSFMAVSLIPIVAYFSRVPSSYENGTDQRILPYPWFTEDEPYKLLGYHPTFIVQLLALFCGAMCNFSSESSTALLIMLAAGYFHQLHDRLSESSELATDSPEELKEIWNCLKYHQRLLDFCYELKKFAQMLLFSQLATIGLSISLVSIKLAGSDPNKYDQVPILILCIGIAFIAQWTPDQLAEKSEAVELAAYDVLMRHRHDRAFSQDLHIMLSRAQVPMQFLAAGFIHLSLENFTAMMKGAYTFYTVLRSFNI